MGPKLFWTNLLKPKINGCPKLLQRISKSRGWRWPLLSLLHWDGGAHMYILYIYICMFTYMQFYTRLCISRMVCECAINMYLLAVQYKQYTGEEKHNTANQINKYFLLFKISLSAQFATNNTQAPMYLFNFSRFR